MKTLPALVEYLQLQGRNLTFDTYKMSKANNAKMKTNSNIELADGTSILM